MKLENEGSTVSIVVPTRNRCHFLSDCLSSLLSQDYPPEGYEIIVVDDDSTDQTEAVVTGLSLPEGGPFLHYVRHTGGLNAARNRGIAASSGSLVGFIDDDELAPSHLVRAAVRLLAENASAIAIGGEYRSRLEGERPRFVCNKCAGSYKSHRIPNEAELLAVEDLPGGCVFLRRHAFTEFGLFTESLSGPGDDSEWFRRTRDDEGTLLHSTELWICHRVASHELRLSSLLRKHMGGMANLVAARKLMGWGPSARDETRQALKFFAHGVRRCCIVGIARGLGQAALAIRWIRATHDKQ